MLQNLNIFNQFHEFTPPHQQIMQLSNLEMFSFKILEYDENKVCFYKFNFIQLMVLRLVFKVLQNLIIFYQFHDDAWIYTSTSSNYKAK